MKIKITCRPQQNLWLNKNIFKLLGLSLFINNFSAYSSLATSNIEMPNRYQTLEGEYITIDDSTQGELHEIEIFGNTIQDENNLEDIQSVGDLYVDENGNPILDSQGREQYKIDIKSSNDIYIDKTTNIEGFEILGATGELNKNSNTIVTDYIRVPNDGQYYIHTSKIFQPVIFQYDKDKNYIPYTVDGNIIYDPWGWSTWYEDKYYIYHQENTHYIRIVFNMTDEDCVYPSLNKDKVFPPQTVKVWSESILLPTQLQKVGDVADRLYWDSEKKKYVIEKNIGIDLLPKAVSGTTETDMYYQNTQFSSFGDKKIQTGHPLSYKNFLSLDNYPYHHYYNIYGDDNGSGVNIWGNHVTWRIFKTDIGSLEEFNSLINSDWRIMGVLKNPEIIETNITSKLKIPTYDGKTYIYVETKNGINPTLKVTVDRLSQVAKNAIEEAKINPTTENISLARIYINMLPESTYKDELHKQLNEVFNTDITIDKKTASANLDIYIKTENMLSMSLDTNSVTFDNYSGVEDVEMLGVVNITINSSLPYSLNAYIPSEISNTDNSSTISLDKFNIRENTQDTYKQFENHTDKLVLKETCEKGNGNIHTIDMKLSSNQAHKADIYKTVIKFEAEQK